MSKERKPLTPEGKARIMAAENPNYITPKQQAFIQHYIANGGNGRQAAISAGYSEKGASVQACELLKMDKIKKRLKPKSDEQKERLALDADWIISRLMNEAEDVANSEAARVRALELLGKVEGIFAPDKKQIETINGGDFLANLDLSDDDERDTVQ
jgi:phage terminase small subunit